MVDTQDEQSYQKERIRNLEWQIAELRREKLTKNISFEEFMGRRFPKFKPGGEITVTYEWLRAFWLVANGNLDTSYSPQVRKSKIRPVETSELEEIQKSLPNLTGWKSLNLIGKDHEDSSIDRGVK